MKYSDLPLDIRIAMEANITRVYEVTCEPFTTQQLELLPQYWALASTPLGFIPVGDWPALTKRFPLEGVAIRSTDEGVDVVSLLLVDRILNDPEFVQYFNDASSHYLQVISPVDDLHYVHICTAPEAIVDLARMATLAAATNQGIKEVWYESTNEKKPHS